MVVVMEWYDVWVFGFCDSVPQLIWVGHGRSENRSYQEVLGYISSTCRYPADVTSTNGRWCLALGDLLDIMKT
jgi:hypothetical protein